MVGNANFVTVKKESQKALNNTQEKSTVKPHFYSLFNTRVTLLHFGANEQGQQSQKKAFFLAYYRTRNLMLADKLDRISNTRFFTKGVEQVRKYLRCCSARTILSRNDELTGKVITSGKTCKSPHCAICARQKSAKLGKRFVKWLNTPTGQKVTDGKYWYFLTFTLRHNTKENVRQNVYLKELKGYMKKFVRHKDWVKYFGKDPKSKKWLGGWFTSYEMTLGKDGYHIHAHTLVCGNPIEESYLEYQMKLRANWKKLTGDSWNMQFHGIKGATTEETGELRQKIVELFKYTTKLERLSKISNSDIMRYAEWIDETRGKNFINASGLLRGHKLTGLKSPLDDPAGIVELNREDEYFYVMTKDIVLNQSLAKSYDKTERKRILKTINVDGVAGENIHDVSEIIEETLRYVDVWQDDYKQSVYGAKTTFDGNRLYLNVIEQNNYVTSLPKGYKWQENEVDQILENAKKHALVKELEPTPDDIFTDFELVDSEQDIWVNRFKKQTIQGAKRQMLLGLLGNMEEMIEVRKSWNSEKY